MLQQNFFRARQVQMSSDLGLQERLPSCHLSFQLASLSTTLLEATAFKHKCGKKQVRYKIPE